MKPLPQEKTNTQQIWAAMAINDITYMYFIDNLVFYRYSRWYWFAYLHLKTKRKTVIWHYYNIVCQLGIYFTWKPFAAIQNCIAQVSG